MRRLFALCAMILVLGAGLASPALAGVSYWLHDGGPGGRVVAGPFSDLDSCMNTMSNLLMHPTFPAPSYTCDAAN